MACLIRFFPAQSPDSPEPGGAYGQAADLWPLTTEEWLPHAEVRYVLRPVRGRWEVSMVFLSGPDPLTWVCRHIGDYPTEAKARQAALLLKRSLGKDARGTQKTQRDALDFCPN